MMFPAVYRHSKKMMENSTSAKQSPGLVPLDVATIDSCAGNLNQVSRSTSSRLVLSHALPPAAPPRKRGRSSHGRPEQMLAAVVGSGAVVSLSTWHMC